MDNYLHEDYGHTLEIIHYYNTILSFGHVLTQTIIPW